MAAFPDLYSHITGFSFRQKRVINVEMETSALYALGRSLGHRTVSVCLVLANRATGKFLSDYQPLMLKLCRQILDAAGN
jgi:uridine phosphorylase